MDLGKCNKIYPSRVQRGVTIACAKPIYRQGLCRQHHYYLVKRFDKTKT